MQPRFGHGTKIRIKTRSAVDQVLYRDLIRYENQSGVVLSSKAVIGYFARPIGTLEHSQTERPTTLHVYTVKLEQGVTLDDLVEYYLEEILVR